MVGAISEVSGDFAAGLELFGCALKKTANCTPMNEGLDALTLLTAATPLSLVPAELRRLEDLSELANWAHDHPISLGANQLASHSSSCGGIPG